MVQFIPDQLVAPVVKIPFFENITAKDIPGCRTEKSVEQLQSEVIKLLAKLGAMGVLFTPGTYPGNPERYGYQVTFQLSAVKGRFEIAALPLKTETAKKKDRALAQCLFLVRNWLESEVYSQMYRPGNIPLVPYLIGHGDKTVTEALLESKALPMLGTGNGS